MSFYLSVADKDDIAHGGDWCRLGISPKCYLRREVQILPTSTCNTIGDCGILRVLRNAVTDKLLGLCCIPKQNVVTTSRAVYFKGTMETKTCSKCKEVKEVIEFYKDKKIQDGLSLQCKDCVKLNKLGLNYQPNTEGTKVCSVCGEDKSVTEFSKDKTIKTGLRSQCKTCIKLYQAKLNFAPITSGTKICSRCGKVKPMDEFAKDHRNKTGRQARCKLCDALYRDKHREEAAIYSAFYYTEHKKELLVLITTWREINLDKVHRYNKTWRKNNPGKCRAMSHRRRAKKKSCGGSHTAADVRKQGDMQKWICWWGAPGCKGYCKDEYHVDHIIPISKDGHNNPSNIVISCPHCNESKGNKLPEEWIGRLF